MKKTALLLAGLLMVSALGGCGNSADEKTANTAKETVADTAEAKSETTAADTKAAEEEAAGSKGDVTISLLSWYTEEQLGAFITAFEGENPGVTIDLQYVPPVQQYVDKFSVLVASGQMTDMFYTAAENKKEVFLSGSISVCSAVWTG